MKGIILIPLLVSLVSCAPYQSGNSFTRHLTIETGNLNANDQSGASGGSILQSVVLNSGANQFKNIDLGALRTQKGNNFMRSDLIQAGNVGANLGQNDASAKIAQTTIANNNRNKLLNQYNNSGNQYGSDFTTLAQTKVANANANIQNAQGSQLITQNNAANSQSNEFNNVGKGQSASSSPWWGSSYSS